PQPSSAACSPMHPAANEPQPLFATLMEQKINGAHIRQKIPAPLGIGRMVIFVIDDVHPRPLERIRFHDVVPRSRSGDICLRSEFSAYRRQQLGFLTGGVQRAAATSRRVDAKYPAHPVDDGNRIVRQMGLATSQQGAERIKVGAKMGSFAIRQLDRADMLVAKSAVPVDLGFRNRLIATPFAVYRNRQKYLAVGCPDSVPLLP